MSYFLTMSYNKVKDDKSVYDNTVMLKNYFLGSFFDKKKWCSLSLVSVQFAFRAANAKLIFYAMISI